jgi:beta-phosphoglucomutase family hydrolase
MPQITLPAQDFAGYIFDCDGTLVDTMPLHFIAWTESLRRHAAPFDFSEERFYSLAGVREQDTVILLNQEYGTDIDPESVAQVKAALFHEHISQVQPIRLVADIARRLHAEGKPVAVASGSEEETVRACLTATGLISLFDIIITPRLVAKGKPAPDMFLLAAQRMGVPPSECLVFEDGQSGLDAAQAAGMASVFIPRRMNDEG